MKIPDVAIVGAGIIGAACADALSARGLAVVILESEHAGSGTTAAGMGHLSVMAENDAEFALSARSLELWREWAPDLSDDCEDDACGTLWVAADDEEMDLAREKAARYAARGVDAELLDAEAVRAAEPELRSDVRGGLRLAGDRVIYPPAVARWLLHRACGRGAVCKERTPVRAIQPGRVDCETERIEASVVINAAGAYAPTLTQGVPIEPRRGHLVITDRYPGFIRHQIVELGYLKNAHGRALESIAMNAQPRKTGQVLIGSTREFVGFDPVMNRSLRDRMLQRAVWYLPRLGQLDALRTWVGFRPTTPDNLPLIGEWDPGLYLAAGHEGLGITTAPATGELIADLVTGARPIVDPAPFDPLRFHVA